MGRWKGAGSGRAWEVEADGSGKWNGMGSGREWKDGSEKWKGVGNKKGSGKMCNKINLEGECMQVHRMQIPAVLSECLVNRKLVISHTNDFLSQRNSILLNQMKSQSTKTNSKYYL